jgi:hypothetical protein
VVELLRKSPNSPSTGVIGFLHVRNECLRIGGVLDHHRRLGVSEFFVIDNLSEDGTREYLATQDDVNLFLSRVEYSQGKYGLNATNELLDRYGSGRWCLTVDADEYFVYPHCETKNLSVLTRFLEANRYDSMFAVLLDMYGKRSISETSAAPGQSLWECCPHFDLGPYARVSKKLFPFFELRGGPRQRVFWDSSESFHPPAVSKVPLVKWQTGYRYVASTHFMKPAPQRLADLSGALLHFKFLSDFHDRARLEALRGQHFAGAREYKKYLEGIQADPELTLHFEGSGTYRKSGDLVQSGICRNSGAWSFFM